MLETEDLVLCLECVREERFGWLPLSVRLWPDAPDLGLLLEAISRNWFCFPRSPCSNLVIIERTWGRYFSRVGREASSERQSSRTARSSSGNVKSSLCV
jgi:hypothetical protein